MILYKPVPESEIRNRIRRLQKKLVENEFDGALIVQNVDLFYFSGTMQVGQMYVPAQGEPLVMIRKSVERAQQDTPFEVIPLQPKRMQEELERRYTSIHKVGIELDVVPYNHFERIQKSLPRTKFFDVSSLIREIRMIKSEYEIMLLQTAATIQHDALLHAIRLIPNGITEIELAAEIEHYIRTHGHIGVNRTRAFNQELVLGAVLSGPEAAIPSYFDGPAGGSGLTAAAPAGSGFSPIRPNEPILIDFCACYEGYNFDQTRLVVWGELDEKLVIAYDYARQILREMERMAKPGVLPQDLYQRALEMVEEWGLSQNFMGYGNNQAKFLGHGVGLEVDEWPVLAKGFTTPLEVGMTIAIEPKFTFPNVGIVGLENTYVVTNDGIRSLSVTSEEIIRI